MVNSASEAGTGGKGIDGEFNLKGGAGLWRHGQEIPSERAGGKEIRIPTGEPLHTQPGMSPASAIMHAVGPDYRAKDRTVEEMDILLKSAYRHVLEKAGEIGAKSVGMCILSAAKRKGSQTIAHVTQIAVDAVFESAPKVMEVALVGYTAGEVR